MTDANGKPELIFRSGYTCAICGQYVPTSVKNHIHYSPKVLELQAENDDLKKTQAELINSLNAEGGRYAQLRGEIDRLNVVYQLAVAECNKATGERNKLREVLQMAKNGLEWWKNAYPLAWEECDYDALTEIDAVLEATK